MNTQTSNYPATVREPVSTGEKVGMTVPKPLEVLGPVPTPPAGYTPDYFVNEFAKDPAHELVGYSAPVIERPGYTIQPFWNPEDGVGMWIDHNRDEIFSVPQIRDLIATLTGLLEPAHEAPEV